MGMNSGERRGDLRSDNDLVFSHAHCPCNSSKRIRSICLSREPGLVTSMICAIP